MIIHSYFQEGHTAQGSAEEADAFAKDILDLYTDVCENILAIPMIRGRKTATERFAGADETYTIEALMQVPLTSYLMVIELFPEWLGSAKWY